MDVPRRNDLRWDAIASRETLSVCKPLPVAYDRVAGLLRLDPAGIVMVACHMQTCSPRAYRVSAPRLSAGPTKRARRNRRIPNLIRTWTS